MGLPSRRSRSIIITSEEGLLDRSRCLCQREIIDKQKIAQHRRLDWSRIALAFVKLHNIVRLSGLEAEGLPVNYMQAKKTDKLTATHRMCRSCTILRLELLEFA